MDDAPAELADVFGRPEHRHGARMEDALEVDAGRRARLGAVRRMQDHGITRL
jgi:hypothetical protein